MNIFLDLMTDINRTQVGLKQKKYFVFENAKKAYSETSKRYLINSFTTIYERLRVRHHFIFSEDCDFFKRTIIILPLIENHIPL